jgi:predicted transcriptional regulator
MQRTTANTTRGSTDPPNNERSKVRLSLDISPELNELLDRLAATIGGTKSDVLRKAIALMEVAVEAKRQGKKFGIAEKDQPLATEIIGL